MASRPPRYPSSLWQRQATRAPSWGTPPPPKPVGPPPPPRASTTPTVPPVPPVPKAPTAPTPPTPPTPRDPYAEAQFYRWLHPNWKVVGIDYKGHAVLADPDGNLFSGENGKNVGKKFRTNITFPDGTELFSDAWGGHFNQEGVSLDGEGVSSINNVGEDSGLSVSLPLWPLVLVGGAVLLFVVGPGVLRASIWNWRNG